MESRSGRLEIKPVEIGLSSNSVPINAYLPEKDCKILVLAGQHGEEAEAITIVSKALRSLQEPLKANVILCANPDGVLAGTRCNANGVDLNRNFPTKNWKEDPVYHRWDTASEQKTPLSPGVNAGSEPETKALINFIETKKIDTIISLHSPLGCIDDPLESDLAHWISKTTRLPLVTDIGYPTPGSLGSWASENKVTCITYELTAESIWELLPVHLPVISAILKYGEQAFNHV